MKKRGLSKQLLNPELVVFTADICLRDKELKDRRAKQDVPELSEA